MGLAPVTSLGQQPMRERIGTATKGLLLPLMGIAVVVGLLELITRVNIVSAKYFPPPTDVFLALARQFPKGRFWANVGDTLEGWGMGLGISMLIGVPIGMAIGTSEGLYRAFRGLLEFLRPIPSVALIPLAILVYGIGMSMTVFLVVFAAVWPILVQSMYGVHDLDTVVKDTARSFAIPWHLRVRSIVLPSTAPYIWTGIKVSSSIALIMAVTAELVVGAPGLGRSITVAESSNATAIMYGLVLATGLIGWGLNYALGRCERWSIPWHLHEENAA